MSPDARPLFLITLFRSRDLVQNYSCDLRLRPSLDRQTERGRPSGPLRATGTHLVFRETASGAKTDRAQLRRVLGQRGAGDVLMVTRIDRLVRSTFDLFAIVKQIVDPKAQFRSLAEPWADTGTSTGRLMLAVLGGLADVERDLIRTRTAEGRSRAKP